jgi:hypothetical protein
MDAFMAEYWEKCSPNWKLSTVETATGYRRSHIDGAFPDAFVDSLTEAEVTKWFVALTDRSGPGAANRCLEILRAAFNKAGPKAGATVSRIPTLVCRFARTSAITAHAFCRPTN